MKKIFLLSFLNQTNYSEINKVEDIVYNTKLFDHDSATLLERVKSHDYRQEHYQEI